MTFITVVSKIMYMRDKNVQMKRWATSGEAWGVPELEMFGFDNTRKAIPLPVHRHEQAYEFVYIESGKAGWEVERQIYETRTGEVFHSRPGETHRGSYDVIEPCRFWWFIVRLPEGGPAAQGRCLGLNGEELNGLLGALNMLPRVTKPGAGPLRCLRRIRSAMQRSDRFAAIEIRLCLVDFLLQLCAAGGETETVPPDLQNAIDDVLRAGTERPEWSPGLQELAAQANVSPSHYHRIFKAYTGLTPKKYFEHIKISEASRLLRETPMPITDIAYRLGYSSTQHFAAAFRRFSGQTPTGWRAIGPDDHPG